MLAASFGPEVVEEKTSENVKRLSPVRETTRVVSLKVRGVVFLFEDSLPEKDEGPGDGEAVGRLPFIPSATEGIPGLLGRGAIHEAVLGRLRETLVATFAGGLEPHGLEPRAHWEPSVEGRELQSILYGGRWWLPPSPGHGESSSPSCLWLVPTPKGVPECDLTLLWLVLDADSCLIF